MNMFQKAFLTSFTLLFLIINSNSQDSYINKRKNIKISYSYYQDPFNPSTNDHKIGTQTGRMEFNYGISSKLLIGASLGYGYYSIKNGLFNHIEIIPPHRFLYGGNFDYQILPYFIKGNDFRFDLYLSGKFGGIFYFMPDKSYLTLDQIMDYGVYAGSAFFLKRNIGCFIEYGYGNLTNLRYGISLKFKKKGLQI